VALAAVLALPVDELARTEAPFALLYMQATGQPPTVITIVSLFAVVNGALIQNIMASRILYGMSREGWLHESLGRVHPVRRTPLLATALVTLATLVLALWLPLVTLAKATSFITLVAFSLINLALLRIKHHNPHPAGMRIYPVWIPWAGFLSSFAFVLYQLATIVVR
jgi:amino acid transporter